MSIQTYNFLWGMKMFWRKNVKRIYVDLRVKNPLFFLNDLGVEG